MKYIGENSGDEQLCQLTVGSAQQPHTEISDNNYEFEEDEDNVFVEPSDGDTLEYIIQNRIRNDTTGYTQCYSE
jgi:hypothetical protein